MHTTPHIAPTGTLATDGLLDVWLPALTDECSAAEHLYSMWLRCSEDGPERRALWRGYCALVAVATTTAEQVRRLGGSARAHQDLRRVDALCIQAGQAAPAEQGGAA